MHFWLFHNHILSKAPLHTFVTIVGCMQEHFRWWKYRRVDPHEYLYTFMPYLAIISVNCIACDYILTRIVQMLMLEHVFDCVMWVCASMNGSWGNCKSLDALKKSCNIELSAHLYCEIEMSCVLEYACVCVYIQVLVIMLGSCLLVVRTEHSKWL